jgi:proteasome accessory factor A
MATETNDTRHCSFSARPRQLPKLCGADVELGNFIVGRDHSGGTGAAASRALLREIDGLPNTLTSVPSLASWGGWGDAAWSSPSAGFNPQDWGRKYLATNGGCVYIDLDHLELCLPEVISAYDHVAAWHAMLRIAHQALVAANAKLPSGQTIHVLVNTSDGQGNSYGSHLNVLLTRRAWENLFHRKLHYLLYLAAYQASSIVFTGQGKVGAENGAPSVSFQLSQRADFIETLVGEQTTYHRPLVNRRDEALCGPVGTYGKTSPSAAEMARLHCIFFDSTLCQGSNLLKVGVLQIVLAMIEADQVNPQLLLDDPLEALWRWSHDPSLQTRMRLASDSARTAVELQLSFLADAQRFVARGGCDGIVPQAAEILALWEDTLAKLQAGNMVALAPRLDWVLKLSMLQRVLRRHTEWTWESPQLKHLDQLYSSLDPTEGLYWAYARSGLVEQVVTEAEIERFVHTPPEDTRAWTRAALLRRAAPTSVDAVDWDVMRFQGMDRYGWRSYRSVTLANPLAYTKKETAHLFAGATTFDEILDGLATHPKEQSPSPMTSDEQSMVTREQNTAVDAPRQ